MIRIQGVKAMLKATKILKAGMIGFVLLLLMAAGGFAMDDFPEEIEVAALANLFEAVSFDHSLHVELTESCSQCHHHTTGTPVVDEYCAKCHSGDEEMDSVSCQDCHSADSQSAAQMNQTAHDYRFHDDQPNLKAAYHLNCLGCHEEMGGPTGCEDCHAKTVAGNKFYHSGEYAPEPPAQGTESH